MKTLSSLFAQTVGFCSEVIFSVCSDIGTCVFCWYCVCVQESNKLSGAFGPGSSRGECSFKALDIRQAISVHSLTTLTPHNSPTIILLVLVLDRNNVPSKFLLLD